MEYPTVVRGRGNKPVARDLLFTLIPSVDRASCAIRFGHRDWIACVISLINLAKFPKAPGIRSFRAAQHLSPS